MISIQRADVTKETVGLDKQHAPKPIVMCVRACIVHDELNVKRLINDDVDDGKTRKDEWMKTT